MATSIPSNIASYPIKEERYTLPWGQIAGKHWGNTDAPHHILALHGWLDNAGTFDTLFPLLFENPTFSQMYSILALDLPGHGLSDHRGDGIPYHHPDYLIDIKMVLEQLSWEKFSIIGHSLGGEIALLFSSALNDIVERLILIDQFHIDTDSMSSFYEKLSEALQNSNAFTIHTGFKVYPSMEAIVERILSGNEYLTKQAAAILAIRGSKQVDGGFTFTRDIRLKANTLIPYISPSIEFFSSLVVGKLRVPSLLIYCTESNYPQSYEFALSGFNFPDCITICRIQGPHHVHLTQPQRVAPQIVNFLTNEDYTNETSKL